MKQARTFGEIVGAGLSVALAFAYLTRGSPPETQTFVTFATVQGAFIGIVFSIFVLASQVNATAFSPFTLEQLSKSRTFAGLLCYYTFAILVNILFIQSLPTAATFPLIPDVGSIDFIPSSWNVFLGIGAGLTTISLLSLLIARQLLVRLTSPEQLLTRIANDVTVESLSSASESKNDSTTVDRPQRTPLLTIERILESADERGDEYTVQSAIYEMHKATINIIMDADLDLSTHINADKAILSKGEISILLDRWETCLEKGEGGPMRRRHLIGQCHRKLLTTLIDKGEYEMTETKLKGLTRLCLVAYQDGSTDPTLLREYEPVFTASVDANATSLLRQIEIELSTVSEGIIATTDTETLQNGQRELLSIVLETRVQHIATVITTDAIDTHAQRDHAEAALDQINGTLNNCFSILEETENTDAIKQNILTDLHRVLMPNIHKCSTSDEIVTRQLLVAFFELSVKLDRNHSEVINALLKAGDSSTEVKKMLNNLREKSISSEFTAVNISETEIQSFLTLAIQDGSVEDNV